MKMLSSCFLAAVLFITGATFAGAQEESRSAKDTGKVKVSVNPEEAYIWVDGKPMSHRSSSLTLPVGEHKIAVYNYGYMPQVHNVTVASGQTKDVEAKLKPVDAKVSGPWGRIQVEGVPGNALVFLNGTTPEFFVGHADEMNNHIIGDQQLIVPAGTQQVHVLANKTEQQIWAGPVVVKENQRVIIYTKNKPGKELVYKNWPEGKKMNALRRFEAGTATARIAVAPVKAKLAVDQQNIKCDEPVKVSWSSADAANTTIKANDQPVAYSQTGEMEAKPKQTTKYEFRAAGPGGIVTSDATVNVDNTVKTSLAPTAPEIRYVKVGDKVEEQGSTELKWTATNADSVTIDPVGAVSGRDGSQTVTASPQQSAPGPIDETITYKITATNVCGGSDTTTASVHVTGSIGPEQVAAAAPPPELPATASPLPLLLLLGLASVGAGSVLTRKRMK
jgi:PEGA domain